MNFCTFLSLQNGIKGGVHEGVWEGGRGGVSRGGGGGGGWERTGHKMGVGE